MTSASETHSTFSVPGWDRMSRHPNSAALLALLILQLSSVSPAVAATGNVDPTTSSIPMRTVLHYVQGAWTSPAAVILGSEEEWIRWNKTMVASKRAVAPEPLPPGVDWAQEVLLVVSLGEQPTIVHLELEPPLRSGRKFSISGQVERTPIQSFSAPCHVVALNRSHARDIVLDPMLGLLEPYAGGVPLPGNRTRASNEPVQLFGPVSWGGVKHRYH